jgi:hypothetical protein
MSEFESGELFVYVNGERWELGQVKSKARDGAYFCWYSTGDTAACTPVANMHKLENAGWSHVERGGDDDWCEMEYSHEWMGWHCLKCDNIRQGLPDQKPRFCPECWRHVR